jgi:hypothetical protein
MLRTFSFLGSIVFIFRLLTHFLTLKDTYQVLELAGLNPSKILTLASLFQTVEQFHSHSILPAEVSLSVQFVGELRSKGIHPATSRVRLLPVVGRLHHSQGDQKGQKRRRVVVVDLKIQLRLYDVVDPQPVDIS